MTTRPAAALAILLPLAACGGAATPVGDWDVDMAPIRDLVRRSMGPTVDMMLTAQKAELDAMLASMSMSFRIAGDGTWTAERRGPQQQQMAGTWKLDGERITMTGRGAGEEGTDTLAGTFRGDAIELNVAEQGVQLTMKLHRR